MINKNTAAALFRLAEQEAQGLSTAHVVVKMMQRLDLELDENEEGAFRRLQELANGFPLVPYEEATSVRNEVSRQFGAGESPIIGAVVWALTPPTSSSYPPSYALGVCLFNLAESVGPERVSKLFIEVCDGLRTERLQTK